MTPSRDGAGEFIAPSKADLDELSSSERAGVFARAGTPYTVYQIEVSQVTPFRQSWTIERRYRELRDLADALAKHDCPARLTAAHPFPPRKIFLIDEVYLNKRQKGLNMWVSQLPSILQTNISAPTSVGSVASEDYEQHPAHTAVRSFLLPAAIRLLRAKTLATMSETGSNVSVNTTPSSSSPQSAVRHGYASGGIGSSLHADHSRSASTPFQSSSSVAGASNCEGLPHITQPIPSLTDCDSDSNSMSTSDEVSLSDAIIHPRQALALVSCGSFVSEISATSATSLIGMSMDTADEDLSGFNIPITDMNNLITLIYRDGCYSYFRASLLLRRIKQGNDVDIKKKKQKNNIKSRAIVGGFEESLPPPTPGDAGIVVSISGSATFPVRYQHKKVGTVRVEATLIEQEQLRQRFQRQFRNPMTSGPCAGFLVMLMAYVGTGLMMVLVALASLMGYALFRPLHRELKLKIIPSNHWKSNSVERLGQDPENQVLGAN